MASIYDLKMRFQNGLRPAVNFLAAQKVTANQVTVVALLLSMLTGLMIVLYPNSRILMASVPIVLLLRMSLNAIDGMLAREHNMTSKLGALLNELGDVVADAALYLPFALIEPSYAAYVVTVVLLALISEMTGVIAVQIGAERRYDGPMGKSDRAFVFGAVALLLALGLEPGIWMMFVWMALNVLLVVTIFNRAKKALQHA